MEQKSTFWKSAMTHGLYLGVALILYGIIIYVAGENTNKSLGLISYAIMAAGVVYAQINYRNHELNGFISYGQALGYGVVVMLFAGILNSLYSIILFTYIDPGLIDQIRIAQEEVMMARGMSDEQIELTGRLTAKMMTPGWMAISGLFAFGLIGLIISLISSIFVKKQDDESAFENAMTEIKSED